MASMSQDALIPGAAAPTRSRRIRSPHALDALWVVVAAVALMVSTGFALIDLPNQSLSTGESPLRVWTLGLPAVAILVAIGGLIRRSTTVVAAAAGVLAPSVAFAGSLSLALLLDDDSAFADVGVAVTLGAAFLGAVTLLRWFVYHPVDLIGDESRPSRPSALVVAGCGILLGMSTLIAAIADRTSWSAAFVLGTSAMLTVALSVIGAGVLRTRPAMALAGSACIAQIVAVAVVKAEQSNLPLDSRLVLRSGVVGLVACAAGAAAGAVAWARHGVDQDPVITDDDADWRWNATD